MELLNKIKINTNIIIKKKIYIFVKNVYDSSSDPNQHQYGEKNSPET